jgi:DNA integrity scanning protein DisA with diadenylate cyclase activity
MTSAVLRAFFAVFVIALVVIFQEELRQLFEQIAQWGLARTLARNKPRLRPLPRVEVEILAGTLFDLAQSRIGALVVLVGHDPIERHVDGGVRVEGHVSEALLHSIFDPHSMGHDGAVVVARGKIERLGVRLPLTRDSDALGSRGTRHAAALGLSERTDAICLVVSEERGVVSVARGGRLETMRDKDQLHQVVESFCQAIIPQAENRSTWGVLTHNLRQKAAALGMAAVFWFVLAYRAEVVGKYFTVTVEAPPTVEGLAAIQLSPSAVEVMVSGPRRMMNDLQARDIKLTLGMTNLNRGFQLLPISESQFSLPAGLELTDLRPRQVFVNIEDRKVSPNPR